MRVVKSFDTKKFHILSQAIDTVLTEVDYPWHFERMHFILSKNEFQKIAEDEAEIYLDKRYVSEDEKFVRAYLYHVMVSMICKLSGRFAGNEIVDRIISDREMIKKGLGNYLFYYYYIILHNKERIDSYKKYVYKNIPWISFSGIEKYDSDMLREAVDRMRYRKAFQQRSKKLFDILCNNLSDDKNTIEALKLCNRIR